MSSEIPLHLFQVLEEEYLSLHGALSPGETVRLRDRPADIRSELNWNFHQGHVKDPRRLAFKLTPSAGRGVRDDLAAHLEKVSPGYSEQRAAAVAAAAGSAVPDLTDALNELLGVKIYDPNAFKYVNLSDSTRLLLKHNAHAEEGSDELAHINRLLLEETFPDELERLSDIRLAAMYQRLHTHSSEPLGGTKEYGQAALCLSGGGIRSGTFALGLLQGLARHNLLSKFDYLSTVSGGGYIGGWLTAWLHRHPRSLGGVTRDLSAAAPKSKIDPDPPAVQYLREYSNFLTPKSGVLTADTWAFIAIYLRNLLLNWVVLFPLLLALLALPRLNLSLLLAQAGTERFIALDIAERYLFLAAGTLLLVLALAYIIVSRPAVSAKITERSSFWRGRRDQRHFLRWCLLPLVGSVFCLTTYWAWSVEAHAGRLPEDRLWWFVIFGVAATLAAWFVSAFSLERFSRPKEMGKLEAAELIILLLIGAGGGAALFYTSRFIGGRLTAGQLAGIKSQAFEWYAVGAVPGMLAVILLLTILFVGFTSKGFLGLPEPLNDEDREWWARFTAWVLIAMLAWAAFGLISIHAPRLFFWAPKWIASVGGVSGLVSLLVSYSSRTPANEEQAKKAGLLKTFLRDHLLPFLALVFLLIFAVALAFLVTVILHSAALLIEAAYPALDPMRSGYNYWPALEADAHLSVTRYSRLWFIAAFIVAAAGLGLFLANRINLNKFSLHAGYRNRLIRGFLGASRDRAHRRPNPFTGFDPEDNVHMHELRPALFHEGDFTDLEGLAVEIGKAKDEKDTLAGRLHSWLERETQLELESYAGGTQLPPRLRINLLEDLNSVLEDEHVVPVADASAGQQTLTKVERPAPQDDRSIMVKRAVLQRAYPDKIVAKYPPPHRLLHVVNTALNLVGGKRLAWQQRKAEPFAFTPLHCGSFRIGYRRSRHYGGQRGVSLGTAAAISGAAASSNMGYYTTSPVLSMVLTLFNVRLGWWLGNPGPAGDTTYRREAPRVSLRPVVEEAFGLTDDTNPYVYLTDGGHFENLALYEMILRRCRLIVLSDAAEDGDFKFNDLGNAVRKIRIDLGVPIEFDEMRIMKEKPGSRDGGGGGYTYWAFGRIGYSKVDKVRDEQGKVRPAPDGVLIYVKPAVYGDAEPRDVLQYKAANEDFPHQSTGDQFFDEPQFESYRRLGLYIMERICANSTDDLTKEQFVTWALKNYGGTKPPWLEKLLDPTITKSWLA